MSGSARRLAGLDAWRVALLAGGLLVHGSLWQEQRPLFFGIWLVSNAFRMGAFFALAGYLAAASIGRTESGRWLRARMVSLGVPLLFGWLCLSPLCWLLGQLHPGVAGDMLPILDWHHLWFLVALMIHSVLLAWWDGGAHRFGRPLLMRLSDAAADGHVPYARLVLMTALLGGAAGGLAEQLAAVAAPPPWHGMLAQSRYVIGYLPLFVLGVAAARSARIHDTLLRAARRAAAALVLLAAFYLCWFQAAHLIVPPAAAAIGYRLIPAAGSFLAPPLVFSLILATAGGVRPGRSAIRWFADAGYTVYVVHVPVLLAVNTAFAFVALDPHLEYVLAVAFGGFLSLSIYWLGVQRSPALALLLAGRTQPRGAKRLSPA